MNNTAGVSLCALLLITVFIFPGSPVTAAILSADEFLSHGKGADGCVSAECHAAFTEKRAFTHDPAAQGVCDACHRAASYPARYGIERDQRILCSTCHTNVEEKIRSSRIIHGPIKNGDCTACHDPHGSNRESFLRQNYSSLCSSCHNLKRLFDDTFVHEPVRDGNCGFCHDPHASNIDARLTDSGANLCVMCHEEMIAGMAGEHVHEPLITSGCSDCHDPHAGKNRLRLKMSEDKICFSCHEEKKNEISQYSHGHAPAAEGTCISCHSPHFSDSSRYLLRESTDTLCFSCHRDNSIWKERQFQHGPVVQGNCSACHNPHGSDNAYILRMTFPHKFYAAYEKGEYDLCFNCHKEALVTSEYTSTITNFRNGQKNLHWLHVNQKKGRTCRACHDVHASEQEDHIRESFLFGSAQIPVEYTKSDTGGRCVSGCHKERRYDRLNMVENRK